MKKTVLEKAYNDFSAVLETIYNAHVSISVCCTPPSFPSAFPALVIVEMRKPCLCVLFIGVIVRCASASSIVCQSGWDWASNSKRQNPCEIVSALEAMCRGNATFDLAPLTQGTNYPTPQANSSAQDCDCNVVMFSLYMACTACQNIPTQPRSFWIQNCTRFDPTQYPGVIPQDTVIPNWAYTLENNFDPAVASSAGDQPERPLSTPTTSPSSSSVSRTSSSPISTSTSSSVSTGGGHGGSSRSTTPGLPTSSLPASFTGMTLSKPTSTSSIPDTSTTGAGPTPTPTSAPLGPKSSSKVGIIIGGVLGALGFVLGVVIWYVRRARQVSRGEGSRDDSDRPGSSGRDVLMFEYGTQPSWLRTYDPSGPPTFPEQAGYSPIDEGYAAKKGHYSGIAEL